MKNKDLIYIGLGLGAAYFVGKPLMRAIGIVETPKLKELDEEDKKILPRPNTPGAITRDEAAAIADVQLAAMARPGTDEATLFESLQNLSGPALRQVFVEFGDRWYDRHFGTESYSWYPFAIKLNLFGWYGNELNRASLQKMAAIWQKSGLQFPQIPKA